MSRREQVLSDNASGNLTTRHEVAAPERHGQIGAKATDLGRAIDRLASEARSKDTGGEFRPATARTARDELLAMARRNFKNELGAVRFDVQPILATIVIMERMPLRCGACNGVGSLQYHGKPVVVCEECRGTGKQAMTNDLRAKALGRTLTPEETKALHCLLMVWDENEYSCSSAVGELYRADER